MRPTHRRTVTALAGGGIVGALLITTAASGTAMTGLPWTGVPMPQPRVDGASAPNVLSPQLAQIPVAQGSQRLENGTTAIPYYGYDGDGPLLPAAGSTAEASKTEPDKNTYLVLDGQRGADRNYNYGRHFLYQGHEGGTQGYITRINLDADGRHRVTMLASTDVTGKPLPTYDGSTWDPFARRLLFTAELGNEGGVWQATLDVPSRVEDISGALGRAGYEGVQNDSAGNVWLVEDVGGARGTANPNAKQPNSFVYRFVPERRGVLTAGRLQVLQVLDRSGDPIRFHEGQADRDIRSDAVKALHTYGRSFRTRWVTLHDTAKHGKAPFDANALAKAKGGTPFKRPENGVFRPGSDFAEFAFTETGDTETHTEAGAAYGGFGAVFVLSQRSATRGTLRMLYRGDRRHTGLDNLSWLTDRHLLVGEDASDNVHAERGALDSAYVIDRSVDYSQPDTRPLRWLAEGRDASATLDAGLGDAPGFQNSGDNEITGIHVSDGDPTVQGTLGAKVPKPFAQGTAWRIFWTQQHGDNTTWEVIPRPHMR